MTIATMILYIIYALLALCAMAAIVVYGFDTIETNREERRLSREKAEREKEYHEERMKAFEQRK